MPRYVKSHTVQLVNPKIKRLREDHGLAAVAAWWNVMLAAKSEQPEGRFLTRQHLEDAVWPESREHIDALISVELVIVHKDGQHAVSGWAKWQSADSRLRRQEERTKAQQDHMRAKWKRQKVNQKARRSAPVPQIPPAENSSISAPKAEHRSTPIPPLSAPNTPNRVYSGPADKPPSPPSSPAYRQEANAVAADVIASEEQRRHKCSRCEFVGLLREFPAHDRLKHPPDVICAQCGQSGPPSTMARNHEDGTSFHVPGVGCHAPRLSVVN